MKFRTIAVAVAVLAAGVWPTAQTATANSCTPMVAISNAPVTNENQSLMKFAVFQTAAQPGCQPQGSVHYATVDDPNAEPVPGQDYELQSGVLSWTPALPATQFISIVVKKDHIHPEPDEAVKVCLHFPVGVQIRGSGCATGMIHSTPWCARAETGQSALCSICVEIAEPHSAPVVVNYATANGTAVAGEDFVGVADGRVTIPPGETMGFATVEILSGRPGDPDEEFTLDYRTTSDTGTESGQLPVTVGR